MSKELLKEHTYEKDDTLYCKHCNNEIKVEYEKFSYNHGYHTLHTWYHRCDCEGYSPVNPIEIEIRE